MAPEVFLQDCDMLVEDGGSRRRTLSGTEETELLNPASPFNTDTWSLGVIALQIIAVSWYDNIVWQKHCITEIKQKKIDLFQGVVADRWIFCVSIILGNELVNI